MHPQRFAAFLEKPLSGVLRAKGFIWLASRADWAISYSRCGNIATIEPVGRWWAAVPRERWPEKGSAERDSIEQAWQKPYGDRINEVVFIGRFAKGDQDYKAIEQAFKTCQLSPSEIRKGTNHWRNLPDDFPEWEPVVASADE